MVTDRKTAEKLLRSLPKMIAKLDARTRAADVKREQAIEACKCKQAQYARERQALAVQLREATEAVVKARGADEMPRTAHTFASQPSRVAV